MKKRNLLPLLVFIIFGTSCSKNDEYTPINIDTSILISVVDSQGADLLDHSTANHFSTPYIKIFHLIDEEKIEYKSSLYHERYTPGFRFYAPNQLGFNDNTLFCLNATDPSRTEELPITYIQWSELDTDTIKCQFSRTEFSVFCTKVWCNGIEVWDVKNNNPNDARWFQIVKP